MNNCPVCSGPMQALFTGSFCPKNCDKKQDPIKGAFDVDWRVQLGNAVALYCSKNFMEHRFVRETGIVPSPWPALGPYPKWNTHYSVLAFTKSLAMNHTKQFLADVSRCVEQLSATVGMKIDPAKPVVFLGESIPHLIMDDGLAVISSGLTSNLNEIRFRAIWTQDP